MYFIEISVKDSGEGISPEDQLRIFERFFRVDTARSRQDGGSGIGLSLVKHICSNHGGRALVESTLGKGATFTMQLPIPSTTEAI
jgi:two-component system sensor histidine kinase SenX3